jgi:UDP-glucose:(heptosyl)LPS alpha-1,3-glucosyltransferase
VKIALVNETVDPQRGGAETSIVQMALRLAEGGADVAVVAADHAPLPPHPRLRLVTLSAARGPRWLRTCKFLRAARHWCDQQQTDIVHAVTPCERCDVYQPRGGTYRATVEQSLALTSNPLWRGVKRTGRLLNIRQQMLARIERQLLRAERPPHVAAVSEFVARQVRELSPHFPPARLRVIFNACDIERAHDWSTVEQADARTRLNLAHDTPTILFVAHNFKLKGLSELLAALAEPTLRNSGVALVVIGRDRIGPFEAQARRLGVASRVRFDGAASSLLPWFNAADVLAHPTWYDPCSRVVLEALCHGLPVVTTRHNGAAEVVTPDLGRVLDSPRDTVALAGAIIESLDPDIRRRAVSDSARLRERLSMRRHAQELRAFYDEIVKVRGQNVGSKSSS